LHDMMEGRDYRQLKNQFQTDQDGDTIASETECQKHVGNSRKLTKKTICFVYRGKWSYSVSLLSLIFFTIDYRLSG